MPRPFSDLYDLTLPYLPGADPGIVDASIRKAAREFLKRTTLIREVFSFVTVPGTDRYQLNGQLGQVASVIEVLQAGHPRPMPVATEEMRRYPRSPSMLTWWSPLPTVLALFPTPAALITVTVEAAMTLPQDAEEIPDGIFESYGEVVAQGVLSIMYAMPGKPWTTEKGAIVAGRAFAQEIKTIRGRMRDGGQPNNSTFSATRRFGV